MGCGDQIVYDPQANNPLSRTAGQAEAELVPIIKQLRAVAEKHGQTVIAHKAEMAVQLLETRDGRTLNELSQVLANQQSATPKPAVPDVDVAGA